MSSRSLIDLALKLNEQGISGEEYVTAYVSCNTTASTKIFTLPISDDGYDNVLSQVNWLEQRGSESKKEQIDKDIDYAIKHGKQRKHVPQLSFAQVRVRRYNQDISKKGKLSIINLVNANLTLNVQKNMIAPRLVYRTGRLAESIKVLDVVETANKDGLSFIYTWQISPYAVFSKKYGRAPWYTPDRDVDTLSAMSIRETAKRFYSGRIYTRRAW